MDKASVEWFKSYLMGRVQCIDVSGTHSALSGITCGVPQGSILGPLLFLLYVNDMDASVRCKLLLYADDSALIVSGKSITQIEKQLSAELLSLSYWLCDNKLSLHLCKTESILFGNKSKLLKCSSLRATCGETEISPTTSVKYLGAH